MLDGETELVYTATALAQNPSTFFAIFIVLLTCEMFGRAKNHGKKFPKYGQTSFSGIVNSEETALVTGPSVFTFLIITNFKTDRYLSNFQEHSFELLRLKIYQTSLQNFFPT